MLLLARSDMVNQAVSRFQPIVAELVSISPIIPSELVIFAIALWF